MQPSAIIRHSGQSYASGCNAANAFFAMQQIKQRTYSGKKSGEDIAKRYAGRDKQTREPS
jgi:hypothetical protein